MKSHLNTKDITIIGIFASIIVICAWITIPTVAVPFTLQTFAVFTVLNVLGGKKGLVSILIYILLGIVGLPVFSNFNGGLGYLLGPTGGYVLGFILQAIVFITFEQFLSTCKYFRLYASLLGLIICYLCGTAWFVIVYSANIEAISFNSALITCVVPFIIPDIIKLSISLIISKRIRPSIH